MSPEHAPRRPSRGRSRIVIAHWVCGGLLACTSPNVQPSAPGALATAEPSWPEAPRELSARERPFTKTTQGRELLAVLETELVRAFAQLREQPDPVHFLAYQVTDREGWSVGASHGALMAERQHQQRQLDVDLRVGSRERDSTHRLPGDDGGSTFRALRQLPLADDGQALRDALWLATDDEYEVARQNWMRVTSSELRRDAEKRARGADFSVEPPQRASYDTGRSAIDPDVWRARVIRLSNLAKRHPNVLRSDVSLEVTTETRYLVSSEGTRIRVNDQRVRVSLSAGTLAPDGMALERFDAVDVHGIDGLPSEEMLAARFERLFADVLALSMAPLIDPYAGPAVLDGRASGVFFHEIFGHRIEGHRQDHESEGQTFAALVGQQILPTWLDVYDDPRVFELGGTELNGHYFFDDEGVPAQRAELVRAGILKGFLMSRTPARGFSKSNGHGRRQPGHAAVARQANLVVEPTRTVTPETLKQALMHEVERQGLPFGLRFSEIDSGFTQTQRYDTQAFKVVPVMVYRVHRDGREELVRGVDIEGTPLTALSKVTLAANDFQTFNGLCGAESGWVPVSATSPSILLSQIEVARKEQTDAKPPLLPPPSTRSTTEPAVAPSAASETIGKDAP